MYPHHAIANTHPHFTGYNPSDPDYNPELRNRPARSGPGRPENDWSTPPTHPEGRTLSDNRGAEKIIYDNPALSNLLQGRNFFFLEDELKLRLGDWTPANQDVDARADAAYNLARVVNFLDNIDSRRAGNSDRGDAAIDGFEDYGPGAGYRTEASWLKEFSTVGYSSLA